MSSFLTVATKSTVFLSSSVTLPFEGNIIFIKLQVALFQQDLVPDMVAVADTDKSSINLTNGDADPSAF